jgi:pyruvate-formate lyase-activating enzyme
MAKRAKVFERLLVQTAKGGWVVYNKLNSLVADSPSFTPKWSDKPLLKSYQKEKPPLGWPRTTDSLCPKCVPEIRQQIVDGKLPHEILLNEKVGEIKAQIIERDGQILMVKDCPNPRSLRGRHVHRPGHVQAPRRGLPRPRHPRPQRRKLHNHGTSTVTHGRGSVLTIDLTNRCNMMCDPCFMDANQVGFVHELTWDEIKTMLDNAITIKPKRQMSVQFSGGEPTLSPYFLDAVAYARKVGYNSVQAATNGIEFAKSKEFAKAAAEAGLRYAYLQFDGIGNAPTRTARSATLFDVKLQAIHNLHEAGVDIVPVTCIINGINNEQVGQHHPVRARQPEEDQLPQLPAGQLHRPRRSRLRRTPHGPALHPEPHGARRQEPDRPRRAHPRLVPHLFMSTFSDWADLVHGPEP